MKHSRLKSDGIRLLFFTTLTLVVASVASALDASILPVRVYVLVGQSNMQGKAGIEGDGSGSLRYLVTHDPDKEYQFLVEADGSWRERSDVWIYLDAGPGNIQFSGLRPGYGSSGGLIGPELGFGHKMGDAYDGQVLLIKTCWGGKSLGHNFLPPSIGKYPMPTRPGDPGYYYREILRIVNDVTTNIRTYFPDYRDQGIEIAGLCYHQGWNDQYGGLDATYEENLAAFIKDIRSPEYGLSVPGLPVVIATSGMIEKETPIKEGQLAMGDPAKYPQFAGNVSVVDTDKPYGPNKMPFKFYTEQSPNSVGYHWNRHARTYVNIGIAMAEEMKKLVKPRLPSRLVAHGTPEGVELTWQLGSETPKSIKLLRNGKDVEAKLSAARTVFVDAKALPGRNTYELVFDMPTSPRQTLTAGCDTSVAKISAYRSMEGVMLRWEARGRYEGFEILRDGKVIAGNVPADARTYEDKEAPSEGQVEYAIQPTTGDAAPARITVNRGPVDPGAALIYEPFDYPADPGAPQSLLGEQGAVGTKGSYFNVNDGKPERAPSTLAGGLEYGTLPVTGNRCGSHRWSPGCAIALDESLKEAGLLKDGATLWISYVFKVSSEFEHRQGGGCVTLRTEDLEEGVGLQSSTREFSTVVVMDGKVNPRRITSVRNETPTLVVGKIVWGQDGEEDSFVPYTPGPDLKLPEDHGRPSVPFKIDQTKLSLLALEGEGQFDEIRVGPTYESVVGGGAR